MKPEKILSLDLSSKTGWSVQTSSDEGIRLDHYGRIEKTYTPSGEYPSNFVIWAYDIFNELEKLVEAYKPDILVVEETSKGSKNALSQKILEWVHFLLAKHIKDNGLKSRYLLTEEWRRIVGCNKMTKDDKKRNKEVRTYKKVNKTSISYDSNGKRIGLVGRKHLNVRKANEMYKDFLPEPLIMAQEDVADSLLLAGAYHILRVQNECKNVESVSFDDYLEGKI